MISLLILDHPSWWTATGMIFKYMVIAVAIAIGFALFLKSKLLYFTVGGLIIVPLPLFAIAVAEQPLGLFQQQARHEQIFIYVWICIALFELFLVWVPLLGGMFRSVLVPEQVNPGQQVSKSADGT